VSAAYAPFMRGIRLVPASGGRYEVTLDGELLYSKAELGRHAEPGEVFALIAARIGEAPDRG
jgi:selenoprotein W-related protein